MKSQKRNVVPIKSFGSVEERDYLKQKAKGQGFSLSNYIRFECGLPLNEIGRKRINVVPAFEFDEEQIQNIFVEPNDCNQKHTPIDSVINDQASGLPENEGPNLIVPLSSPAKNEGLGLNDPSSSSAENEINDADEMPVPSQTENSEVIEKDKTHEEFHKKMPPVSVRQSSLF